MKLEYTNQSPQLFAGFYESVFNNWDDINSIAEYKADDTDTEYDITNWGDYQNSIAENCTNWLFDNLPDNNIIKSMTYKELWSPYEYNFMTDRLTIDCDIDIDALKSYCLQAHRDKFDEYLRDNWSSYDGFISFVKNNVDTFEKEPDPIIMLEFYLLSVIDFEQYESFCYELAQDTIFEFLDPIKPETNNQTKGA